MTRNCGHCGNSAVVERDTLCDGAFRYRRFRCLDCGEVGVWREPVQRRVER